MVTWQQFTFWKTQLHPIILPKTWHSVQSEHFHSLDPIVAEWIAGESSLTVKIKELGIAFNVDVVAQTTLSIDPELTTITTDSNDALYREVLLKQGDKALVYAQTIIPTATISGTESMLASLGNQSLGQVLFQSPQAIRGAIEYAEVSRQSQLGQYIEHELRQTMTSPCFIRRSLFQLNNKPLLVCECFLPALFI